MSEKEENVLTRIMWQRKKDVADAKRAVSINELLWEAEKRTAYHSLSAALRAGPEPRIIAEVKKASPSAGELRRHYDASAIAQSYGAAGATAISVLTEPHHFLGSLDDLRKVRKVMNIPVLRKDFIAETYQLAEAAARGADVVLLIVAALEPGHCEILYREALELNLEVIVEVHDRAELDVALACGEAIIGVNSRNLKTLVTDLEVAHGLAGDIPDDRLCIAESGIRTAEDILKLQAAGYDGFLIGESLLRETHPGQALRALIKEVRG